MTVKGLSFVVIVWFWIGRVWGLVGERFFRLRRCDSRFCCEYLWFFLATLGGFYRLALVDVCYVMSRV